MSPSLPLEGPVGLGGSVGFGGSVGLGGSVGGREVTAVETFNKTRYSIC